jgi:hypothetical protein
MHATTLIEALGGTAAVAELSGVKAPSVSGWKESGRIPDDKLIRLAPIAEARGVASRKQLFPDDWHKIWPELVGAEGASLPFASAAEQTAAKETAAGTGEPVLAGAGREASDAS